MVLALMPLTSIEEPVSRAVPTAVLRFQLPGFAVLSRPSAVSVAVELIGE